MVPMMGSKLGSHVDHQEHTGSSPPAQNPPQLQPLGNPLRLNQKWGKVLVQYNFLRWLAACADEPIHITAVHILHSFFSSKTQA